MPNEWKSGVDLWLLSKHWRGGKKLFDRVKDAILEISIWSYFLNTLDRGQEKKRSWVWGVESLVRETNLENYHRGANVPNNITVKVNCRKLGLSIRAWDVISKTKQCWRLITTRKLRFETRSAASVTGIERCELEESVAWDSVSEQHRHT